MFIFKREKTNEELLTEHKKQCQTERNAELKRLHESFDSAEEMLKFLFSIRKPSIPVWEQFKKKAIPVEKAVYFIHNRGEVLSVEEKKKRKRNYWERNKDKIAAYKKEYIKKNPQKRKEWALKARERRKARLAAIYSGNSSQQDTDCK